MKRYKVDNRNNHGKHRIIQCPHCDKPCRSNNLKRHIQTHNIRKECIHCRKLVREDMLFKHQLICQTNVNEHECNRFSGVQLMNDCTSRSSVSGYFRTYALNIEASKDYDDILANACKKAETLILAILQHHPIKVQLIVTLNFRRYVVYNDITEEKSFRSLCEPLLKTDNIAEFLYRAKIYIRHGLETYEKMGSGWIFDSFKSAHIDIAQYMPLAGGKPVDIPKKVKMMKSVINIASSDNKCFLYCILAQLYPMSGKNKERYTYYLDHIDKINMGNVKFPVKVKDIKKIEALNNLSIFVYEWNDDENCAVPIKFGSGIGKEINLLHINNEGKGHYLLIKDFNTFMRYRTKHRNTMFYCKRCLHGFVKNENLEAHTERCNQGLNQIVALPEPGQIEFKAFHKKERKNFVMYFDFESIVSPCKSDPDKSTLKYQKHLPCSYCIVTKSEFSDFKDEVITFTDANPDKVTSQFISDLNRIHEKMMLCYKEHQYPIQMTESSEKAFQDATFCSICRKPLDWNEKINYPVRDHDHTKPKNNYRGAAHRFCNINYFERTKKVPVICHNLKGYDLHLFIINLVKATDNLQVIPETIEKFKAVMTEKFIFLDSFAFLSTSLEKLVESVKIGGGESFGKLKNEYPSDYKDLTRKGVFFYDYASSYNVFYETSIPPKDKFFNQQTQRNINDDDYMHAKNMFQKMECKNLCDYMLLYVKTDALLLCDIFENFRALSLSYYGLDPCHYFSLPGLSYDAMLQMTGVKLDLITDIEMLTMIEENIRGGVSTINHRLFTANNQYLSDYNPNIPTSYIMYVDANNLYGKGMSEKLPTGNFRWLSKEEVDMFNVHNIDAEGGTCYILDVNLQYPKAIHDLHNDYPLAVECKYIEEADLSLYNQYFLKEHNEKFKSTKKLCPDLKDKKNYVCSLKNLKFFIKQGLVLQKIHRILAADQSNFLHPYIEFNSLKRRESAHIKFKSDFFKLMNNAVYGKTIEDIRKRSKVDIVKDKKRAKKLIAKPQFKGFQILDEDVTIVQSTKSKIILNKPIAVGFMVLENAKYVMNHFWYDVLKAKYEDQIKLLLSDTDSFIYAVNTEDAYHDLYNLREYMDLSGYSENTKLCKFQDINNKKVPGKFSDEKPNEIIKEVVALKPKMYSLLTCSLLENKQESHQTAKGITKVAQRSISHQDYLDTLKNIGTTMVTSKAIRSFSHQLYSIEINKRGLSSYDDKKHILDNGIETLSYGHYKI